MNDQTRIIFALMQIDNIISLTKDNEYQQYLYSHLIPLQVELKRQLTNIQHSSKIKE